MSTGRRIVCGIVAIALLIHLVIGPSSAQMRIKSNSEIKLSREPDKYSINRGTEITINLELINKGTGGGIAGQIVNVTFDKEPSKVPSVVKPSGLSEGDKEGDYYLKTDADGKFSFTIEPEDTVAIYFYYSGTDDISPSRGRIWINVLWSKSELLSADFVILMLILVTGVFSYRFFKQKRGDIDSWLQDLRGEG